LIHVFRKKDMRVETLLLSECCVPWIHRNNPAINCCPGRLFSDKYMDVNMLRKPAVSWTCFA